MLPVHLQGACPGVSARASAHRKPTWLKTLEKPLTSISRVPPYNPDLHLLHIGGTFPHFSKMASSRKGMPRSRSVDLQPDTLRPSSKLHSGAAETA